VGSNKRRFSEWQPTKNGITFITMPYVQKQPIHNETEKFAARGYVL
jgi:hypothetical protein